jgi:hypothetical protein
MVEASKQVYAPTRGGLGAVVRRPLRVLEGVGAAVPSPQTSLPQTSLPQRRAQLSAAAESA